MKFKHLVFGLLFPLMAAGQTSDLFDKAPPQIEEALRERIMIYYNAFMSGKYHEALKVVSDESLDDFMATPKDTYKSCEITKINYSENFTKAAVVTSCKGELRWRANTMPVTFPLTSHWKIMDGQWFWYHVKLTRVETPFGISTVTPDSSGETFKALPPIPANPLAAAQQILSKISVDKAAITLKGNEFSKEEVHLTNRMPGPVTVSVDRLPLDGAKVTVDPATVPAGGKATIVFSYDPNDPSIKCGACIAKQALPTVTAGIHVSPTAQVFPVKVTFSVEPKLLNQLPGLPTPQK